MHAVLEREKKKGINGNEYMEELLPPLDIDQIVMLLQAIKCEEVDNEYWNVFSSDYTWNANEVFGSGEDTFFESGDYITVMYNNENPFPTYQRYSCIISSFPHYDYWIEKDLRVLIFKINTTENKRRLLCVKF